MSSEELKISASFGADLMKLLEDAKLAITSGTVPNISTALGLVRDVVTLIQDLQS